MVNPGKKSSLIFTRPPNFPKTPPDSPKADPPDSPIADENLNGIDELCAAINTEDKLHDIKEQLYKQVLSLDEEDEKKDQRKDKLHAIRDDELIKQVVLLDEEEEDEKKEQRKPRSRPQKKTTKKSTGGHKPYWLMCSLDRRKAEIVLNLVNELSRTEGKPKRDKNSRRHETH